MARAVVFTVAVLSLLLLGAGLLLFGQFKEASYCAAGIFLLVVRPPELQLLLGLLGRAPMPAAPAPPVAPSEAAPAASSESTARSP